MGQFDYYTFMGYPSESLRDRYQPYAKMLAEGPVLDVACGRGEFLEILRQHGVEARGVDADATMVEESRRRGADVEQADGTAYLRAHAGEFSGVFAAHLIEHMGPGPLEDFVRAAAGALKPGGRLLVVTPNPANLQMQLRDFWIDLQHVRLYSPEIVCWIFNLAGLTEVQSGENELYRTGPNLRHEELPPLPLPRPPRRPVGRESLAPLLPRSVDDRLAQLEQRVNRLTDWAAGLYPPAEYYVTGLR
jgi:SAM-dependent methyltransferase